MFVLPRLPLEPPHVGAGNLVVVQDTRHEERGGPRAAVLDGIAFPHAEAPVARHDPALVHRDVVEFDAFYFPRVDELQGLLPGDRVLVGRRLCAKPMSRVDGVYALQ